MTQLFINKKRQNLMLYIIIISKIKILFFDNKYVKAPFLFEKKSKKKKNHFQTFFLSKIQKLKNKKKTQKKII